MQCPMQDHCGRSSEMSESNPGPLAPEVWCTTNGSLVEMWWVAHWEGDVRASFERLFEAYLSVLQPDQTSFTT